MTLKTPDVAVTFFTPPPYMTGGSMMMEPLC